MRPVQPSNQSSNLNLHDSMVLWCFFLVMPARIIYYIYCYDTALIFVTFNLSNVYFKDVHFGNISNEEM